MKALAAIALLLISFPAFAGWHDVSFRKTLTQGDVYCKSLSKLEKLIGYVKDGDNASQLRMLARGDCVEVQQPMRITVFQENEDFADFLSPSGKSFYTIKQFVE